MPQRLKADKLRKFGLDLVGDVPWGTHLCQFYETKEDLIDILVPYFAEGLRNNEFCMWITSPPLEVEEAKAALRKVVPDLDEYVQKGQIEILSYTDWYLLGGAFDSARVLQGWVEKEKTALDAGFDGLRLTGNTFWLERKDWKAFTDYEEAVNNVIGKHRMIAICTYSLTKCNANEIIDVIKNHQFALIKRRGKWELIESAEKKRIADDLLKTEEKFAALYNLMTEGVALHDVVYDSSGKAVDYIITDVNPSYERITGLSRKQAVGKKASELYGTGEPPYLDVYAKVVASGKPTYFETYFPPMQKHFSISVFSPSKGKFNTVFHDITERRKMESELSNLAKFPSENPNIIIRLSSDGKLLYSNPGSQRLLGDFLEALGQSLPEKWREYVTETLSSGKKIRFEEQISGLTYTFLVAPIVSEGYVNIYGEDITERKQTEQELFDTLKESQRRQSEISALLKASRAVLQNREFRYSARAIFDSCKELLGATAGYVALLSEDGKENVVLFLESGGLPCSVDPSLPMPIRGLRSEAYNTGKVAVENDFPKSEWNKLMPNGHVALESVLFAPLSVEGKTLGIIGLANKPGGFTERDAQMAFAFGEIASIALINSQMLEMLEENTKKLKIHSEHLEELVEEKTKQLKDAERLATIGETAGMIGHDIRNPLQAIICELYLAKDSLHSLPESDAREDLKESMHVVEEQAIYINKIVTDLQDYAKPLAPFIEEADLEKTIESTITTMDIPESIKVAYSIEKEFPKLMIDASYLKRMVTNLVSNAVQAMPNGGKLTINAYCKNQRVSVNVEDTGEGIPEEAKNKIFKPLFTTKAKGQGFGLAVVKKLTEALNGTIAFESEKGKGTKFTIEFPADCRNLANHNE